MLREAKMSTAPGIMLPQGEGSTVSSKGEPGGPGEEETSNTALRLRPQRSQALTTVTACLRQISWKIRSAVERNMAAQVTLGCVRAQS